MPSLDAPSPPAPAALAGDTGRPVAAFDLDGTVIWADSFTLFLRTFAGRTEFWRRMATLAPHALRYALGGRDRARLKTATAHQFLRGARLRDVERAGALAADRFFERVARADALAALRRHQDDGDRVILITASPDFVAGPIAQRLGCERLATHFAVEDDRLTGELVGLNCRGAEKVARLHAHIGDGLRLTAAYGDSDGDRELLAAAEKPGYRVFRDGPAQPALAGLRLLV